MSENERKSYSLEEAARLTGLERSIIVVFIRQEWIRPPDSDGLDEEDIARIHLILELREKLGVNDEAIPIILHLADQLYFIRNQIGDH